MEYVVQALKVLTNLVHAETNARFLCVINDLWELACEFSIVIYANIRACIKLVSNHAKKSSLN